MSGSFSHAGKEVNVDDPRLNHFNLKAQLVGDLGYGAGLIHRVRKRLKKINQIPVPPTPAGSVIRFGRAGDEPDPIPEDLRLFLEKWLERDVLNLDGALATAADRVHGMLSGDHVKEAHIESCLELNDFLLEWAGWACDHSFRPGRLDHLNMYEATCEKCGFYFIQAPWRENVPLARCEVCGVPIDREANGRPRYTCGDAHRQVKSRLGRHETHNLDRGTSMPRNQQESA